MKQIVLCLIGILFASFVSAQKINHPSLLYTPQRIQQVKQRMQNEPKLREAWEDIQKTADEALQKKDFNRLDYLSLAYLMTDNKEYANIIKEILLKAVEAESWGDMEMMARIPGCRACLGRLAVGTYPNPFFELYGTQLVDFLRMPGWNISIKPAE